MSAEVLLVLGGGGFSSVRRHRQGGSLGMLLACESIRVDTILVYSINTLCILPVRQSQLHILQASLALRLIAHQPRQLPSLFHDTPELLSCEV
jgi:hypothetical protein